MKWTIPYLLMVTFFGPPLQGKLGVNDWAMLSGAPYDGFAVRIQGAYDHRPLEYDVLLEEMRMMKRETGVDPWPWVFLNKMVGSESETVVRENIKGESIAYFSAFRGIDIFDKAGARTNFMDNWQKALRLARELEVPGVVLDVEVYNNYGLYQLPILADNLGASHEDTILGLKELGRDMADVCEREYPGAVVWSLSTGLANRDFYGCGYPTSVSFIVLGFLERCREERYTHKLVAGGEMSVRYCSRDLEHLKEKIYERAQAYAPFLATFKDNLVLGGTIAPWDDPDKRSLWIVRGDCGKSFIKSIEGFRPYFRTLAENYDYVWLYGDRSAPFDPFDPETSRRFNPVLRAGFGKVQKDDKASGCRTESGQLPLDGESGADAQQKDGERRDN